MSQPSLSLESGAVRSDTGWRTLDQDFGAAIAAWPIWSLLGWNDIRQRYRRSVLGPFWITLSMAVLVVVLGFVYSRIFKQPLDTYLPFLALGFIVWGFISSTITDSCDAFRYNVGIITQVKVPLSVHVLRVVWRNLLILAHTVVIFIPIAIYFRLWPGAAVLLAIPGLAMVSLNLLAMGLLFATVSARFRDVPQIVTTLVQIALFATPVMWPVEALGEDRFIAEVNPIYHLIELVRAPLLGNVPGLMSWAVSAGLLAVSGLAAVALFRRVGRRVVYWL